MFGGNDSIKGPEDFRTQGCASTRTKMMGRISNIKTQN